MMVQRLPAGAAGACGSRTSKQPAFASGTSMELSCTGKGVATGSPPASGSSAARR